MSLSSWHSFRTFLLNTDEVELLLKHAQRESLHSDKQETAEETL